GREGSPWLRVGPRLLDPPLAELAAPALAVEAAEEDVAEGPAFGGVAGLTDRDPRVPLDDHGSVLGVPAARLVRVPQPVRDDRIAAADRLAVRPVAVDDVLAEQRADLVRIAGSPCCDVAVQPVLERGVVHRATSLSASFRPASTWIRSALVMNEGGLIGHLADPRQGR